MPKSRETVFLLEGLGHRKEQPKDLELGFSAVKEICVEVILDFLQITP